MRRSIFGIYCTTVMAVAWLLLVAASASAAGFTSGATMSARFQAGEIAYSVKTGIYEIRANGTDLHELIPWRTATCGAGCVVWDVPRHPHFSPNGKLLTYDMETNIVHGDEGDMEENTRAVYVADANGRDRRRLGLGYNPNFTSSGNIVYSLNPNMWSQKLLLEEPPEPFEEDFTPLEEVNVSTGVSQKLPVPGSAEYSSNGSLMVFTHQIKESTGFHTLTTVETTSGTEPRSTFLPRFYDEPVHFTISGEVSYECPAPGDQHPDICLYSPTTGKHRVLRSGSSSYWPLEAANSPHGQLYAVACLQGLFVTNAQGQEAHEIVKNGTGPEYVQSDVPTSPVWQP